MVPEATEFGVLFKVIQGHRCWYQWQVRIRLPMC